MSFGLDFATGPPISAMKAAGVSFVCRYLSAVNVETRVKLLTPEEAHALSSAGIALISNYEWYASRALEGFAAGVADAKIAASQHAACGGPATRPIYFSVDEDVQGAQVAEYFRGVASALGLARTGAYGSYKVIKWLFDNHLIAWGWQTYAWSGGAWEPRAHIQQYANSQQMAGHSVDFDRSMKSDFGQWIQGGTTHMPIPTEWRDDGHTLTAPNGHVLVLGFREHVINAPSWDPGNMPNEEEYHASPAQIHAPEFGDGQRVTLRDCILWWTQTKGVIQEPYSGLELKACYDLIATQQSEIATLKGQPPAPMPNVADALAQLETAGAAAGVIATSLQKALADLKP